METQPKTEAVLLLIEIRDELRRLNEKMEIRRPSKRESVTLDGLPHIAKIWNEWAEPPYSKVTSMSTASTRYKNIVARWKEKPDEAYWVGVIRKLNESMFCKGDNERKWVADIEFLGRPDSAAKLLEGKYEPKKKPEKPKIITGYWENPDTGERVPLYKTEI